MKKQPLARVRLVPWPAGRQRQGRWSPKNRPKITPKTSSKKLSTIAGVRKLNLGDWARDRDLPVAARTTRAGRPAWMVVGVVGFEPTASWSQTTRASQTALHPDFVQTASWALACDRSSEGPSAILGQHRILRTFRARAPTRRPGIAPCKSTQTVPFLHRQASDLYRVPRSDVSTAASCPRSFDRPAHVTCTSTTWSAPRSRHLVGAAGSPPATKIRTLPAEGGPRPRGPKPRSPEATTRASQTALHPDCWILRRSGSNRCTPPADPRPSRSPSRVACGRATAGSPCQGGDRDALASPALRPGPVPTL